MNEIYENYKNLVKEVEKQNQLRNEIRVSQDYINISKHIEVMQEVQRDMLSEVPDSSSLLEVLKADIISDMKEKKVLDINGVTAKTKKKNKVNGIQVYQAFGGDTDMFLTVASITQSGLKKFWTDNPEFKEPLKDCIELVSEDIIDLTI